MQSGCRVDTTRTAKDNLYILIIYTYLIVTNSSIEIEAARSKYDAQRHPYVDNEALELENEATLPPLQCDYSKSKSVKPTSSRDSEVSGVENGRIF